MSDEQLISIEENGDYWLSKSNTAYHIINPNATNLNIDEKAIKPLKESDTYYVLDAQVTDLSIGHLIHTTRQMET